MYLQRQEITIQFHLHTLLQSTPMIALHHYDNINMSELK